MEDKARGSVVDVMLSLPANPAGKGLEYLRAVGYDVQAMGAPTVEHVLVAMLVVRAVTGDLDALEVLFRLRSPG